MDCCGFVNLCFWFVLTQWSWMRTDHTRPDPSALILSVKVCDQETGTNLHTQERNERFSTLQLLTSSVWRHLSPSCFCHLLVGAAQKMHISPLSKKYIIREHNTKHNHTTHNNMSRSCPTLQRLALSLSMGRAVAPPNHGAAAPQRHVQAASCRGCACCRWFACLGR
jgi:hypothetical protein